MHCGIREEEKLEEKRDAKWKLSVQSDDCSTLK